MTAIKISKITSDTELKDCFHIRTIVFINEQNVPLAEEMDQWDQEADHYLLSMAGKAAATARVRYISDIAKIERVAVLKEMRGHNIGQRLMTYIMADIKKNPAIRIMKLGAQTHAITFYQKLGFECYGDEFLDAGIPHKWMTKSL